jgi:SAM-dependent methyltransferase
MRVIVAIASYGTNNDHFLAQLLAEYHAMPYDVHVVVLSNVAKNLGPAVEVVVGLPDEKNPFSLPFAHRKLFGERRDDYDLYIYSEDDTLLRHKNVEAFLKATNALPIDELAGFLRSETDTEGNIYYSTVHNHYHWDPSSVRRVGEFIFAHFTNEHAACLVLTREQLKRAIASGGFLVTPHEGRYGLLEAAATDSYTQCGFRKMIAVSHLDEFTLPHLPNKYIGKLGLPKQDFELQLEVLRNMAGKPCSAPPFGKETNVPGGRWSKSYYEPISEDFISLVPVDARHVLAIGCGWGAMESVLVSRGVRVSGIPLDCIIAPCAAARGVKILTGCDPLNFASLPSEEFDTILLSHILHLVPDPPEYLASVSRLLRAGGKIVVRVPNVGGLPLWRNKWNGDREYNDLADFRKSGVQQTSSRTLRKWLRLARFQVIELLPVASGRAAKAGRLTMGLANSFLAEEFLAVGEK